jgi:hypothetical protein
LVYSDQRRTLAKPISEEKNLMGDDDKFLAQSVANSLRHFFADGSDMGPLEPYRGMSEEQLVALIMADDAALKNAYGQWQDLLWADWRKEQAARGL